MRLQSYLKEGVYDLTAWEEQSLSKEAVLVDKIIPKIKSQCKPFLSKIKSNPNGLFRGVRGATDIIKKKVRQDRRPLDTHPIEQEEIDKAFYDAFGWKPRSNGLFTTPDPSIAAAYGAPMIVFPIGKVRYLWSKEISDIQTIHA